MRTARNLVVMLIIAVVAYSVADWMMRPADVKVSERAAPAPPPITTAPNSTPPTATTSPEPTPVTPSPTEVATIPTVTKPVIKPSPPTRLYQPDTGLDMVVLELPPESRNPVTPPTYMEAYWNPDPLPELDATEFAPGTDAVDLTSISAHTGTSRPDIGFNPLYDWQAGKFAVELGDEVWLQTKASGEQWLVYRLVKQLVIPKNQLANSSEAWGDTAKPNHLLLIGCRQIAVGTRSTDNFVLDFVFDRVDSLPS